MKVKVKTNKSAKKRFKITGTGKVLRHKQGRRHILTKKSSQRKRRLGNVALVAETLAPKYKRLILGM